MITEPITALVAMMPSKIIFVLQATVLFLALACSKNITPPTLAGFPLEQQNEHFRDWRSVSVCKADEHLVERELQRFNAFAEGFFNDTLDGNKKLSEDKKAALLELAPQLQPLLDGFGHLLAQMPKCYFFQNPRIRDLHSRTRGHRVNVLQRVYQAPTLLEAIRASDAVLLWKKNQETARKKAKSEWCPPSGQRGPNPEIYYVSEDDSFVKEWWFCDGTRMIAKHGEEASVDYSEVKTRYPKKLYLDAADDYPDSQVQRPPKK